jgi:hypothetical protein
MPINIGGNLLSSTGFNSSSEILNTPNIVTDGLILWYDVGNLSCYNNTTNYYDCGYGCQYYASDPGCTNCNTQLKDMSGYGHDGGLNVVTVNYLNVGGVASFNGGSSMVLIPNSTVFDVQTITMESWCYPSSITQNGFLFEKGIVNTQFSNFFNSDGTFYFRTIGITAQDLTIYGPSYMTANNWYHIVCTYASGTKTLYINGSQISQQTSLTGTLSVDARGMSIGVYGGYSGSHSYYFSGNIAISRFYTKALSQTEVTQNFNNGRQRFGI